MKRQARDLKPTKLKIPEYMLFFDTETTRIPSSYTKSNGEVVTGVEHHIVLAYYLLVKWDKKKRDYIKVEDGFFRIRWPIDTRNRKLLLRESSKVAEKLVNKIIEIATRRYLRDKTLYVLAHNIKFDYVAMNYHLLKKKGWEKTNQFFVDGARFVAEWVKKGEVYTTKTGKRKYHYHKILFLDTMNYFKTSVSKLGKTLGLYKLSDIIDMNLDKHDFLYYVKIYDWDTLMEYNKRDVEILYQAMRFLIQKIVISYGVRFAYTVAGLAFNVFRNLNKERIRIHGNPWLDKFEKKAYFGGRTEAFRIGLVDEKWYKLDVNSLYPSVMINNLYPVEFMYTVTNPNKEQIEKLMELYRNGQIVYIADVLVNTDQPKYPVKYGGKLVFPVGNFRGIFCSPEIDLLDEDVKKVFRVAVYRAKPIFKDYISYFYGLRKKAKKEKDEVMNYFYKLLMNSLYGKFAETRTVEVRAPEYDIKDITYAIIHEDDGTTIRIIDGEAYVKIGEEVAPNAFVAIAAFVTSYARALMWKYMSTAGMENILYMDTDSLFVLEEGYQRLKKANLIDDYELGKLKLEGVYDGITIYAPKDYELLIKDPIFGWFVVEEEKHKGVPKRSRKLDEGVYKTKKFLGYKEAYKRFGEPKLFMQTYVKQLKRNYDKRIVHEDGSTEPLVIHKYEDPMLT